MNMSKNALLDRGVDVLKRWCAANNVPEPALTFCTPDEWRVDSCAYYRTVGKQRFGSGVRDGRIWICPAKCASIGLAGRSWSYPGYCVDREPYGVLAHELGHHVDDGTIYDRDAAISGYNETAMERFAEHFRLFVTNPDLLRLLAPNTYVLLSRRFKCHIEERSWEEVLAASPRHINAARNRIRRALADR